MKKILLLFALLMAAPAFAQTGVAPRPDCDFGFVFNVVGGVISSQLAASPNRLPASQAGGTVIGWDNRNFVCTNWTLVYQTEGVGALSIELDQAPSAAGIPGTWATWVNTSPGTVWPVTTLNVGNGSSFGYQPWVSVNLNSATGSGQVYGRVFGWRAAPGQSGVGVTSVAGGSAPGTAETTNPLPSGVVESQSSFINYLAGYLNSADGRTITQANSSNIGLDVFNGSTMDRLREGASPTTAQTGAPPIGLLGTAGTTVTYTPTQLGVNALAYGSNGTSAASNTIDLRGAKSFTLTFNGGAGITTLNEIVFAEDGTTTLVTLSAATGCAAATQALFNQPEAGNAATVQNTCTIGTSAKFPLRAVAFTWTNTNATAGTVTGRMFVGY